MARVWTLDDVKPGARWIKGGVIVQVNMVDADWIYYQLGKQGAVPHLLKRRPAKVVERLNVEQPEPYAGPA
jgi:hypothetical protein